jgi:trimethylamine--corrinoid protein Co-methyltransferase
MESLFMSLSSTTNSIKPTFNRLPSEQAERIHAASLEILERIGVQLHHPEAVDLLRKAGAQVKDGNHVCIPPHLVERALAAAPKEVNLYNRLGEQKIVLKDGACYYGPGSDCLNIIDHRTGERRKPVLNDVAEGVRLCCQRMSARPWQISTRWK